jgi:hypothetical protein
MQTPRHTDVEVPQRRTPNKEIVGRIELALYLFGCPVNTGQRAWMPSTQAVRGQFGGYIRTTQHREQ